MTTPKSTPPQNSRFLQYQFFYTQVKRLIFSHQRQKLKISKKSPNFLETTYLTNETMSKIQKLVFVCMTEFSEKIGDYETLTCDVGLQTDEKKVLNIPVEKIDQGTRVKDLFRSNDIKSDIDKSISEEIKNNKEDRKRKLMDTSIQDLDHGRCKQPKIDDSSFNESSSNSYSSPKSTKNMPIYKDEKMVAPRSYTDLESRYNEARRLNVIHETKIENQRREINNLLHSKKSDETFKYYDKDEPYNYEKRERKDSANSYRPGSHSDSNHGYPLGYYPIGPNVDYGYVLITNIPYRRCASFTLNDSRSVNLKLEKLLIRKIRNTYGNINDICFFNDQGDRYLYKKYPHLLKERDHKLTSAIVEVSLKTYTNFRRFPQIKLEGDDEIGNYRYFTVEAHLTDLLYRDLDGVRGGSESYRRQLVDAISEKLKGKLKGKNSA